jgi:hypothetical protein
MQPCTEADKIIKKLQGPQYTILLMVYTDSYKIVQAREAVIVGERYSLPMRELFMASIVLDITHETIEKCRHEGVDYAEVLRRVLEMYPDATDTLQCYFPYRDFK